MSDHFDAYAENQKRGEVYRSEISRYEEAKPIAQALFVAAVGDDLGFTDEHYQELAEKSMKVANIFVKTAHVSRPKSSPVFCDCEACMRDETVAP